MEEINELHSREQIESDGTSVRIGNEPVMQAALDVVHAIGGGKKVILKARGDSIPSAVAVANIVTDKMLNGNAKVQKIILDTENAAGIGKMTSTIEIVIIRV